VIEGVLMHIAPIYVAGYDPNLSDSNPMVSLDVPNNIHIVPGTFEDLETGNTKDPDQMTSGPTSLTLEWEVEEIRVRDYWGVSFDVTSSQAGTIPVNVFPDSRISYSRWDGSQITNSIPVTQIDVLVPPIHTPELEIEKAANGNDILLSWELPQLSAVDNYLIYRSTSQVGFDFTLPWKDTSTDVNPATGTIDPLNCTWVDVGATDPSHPNYRDEYYYIVRAKNLLGMESTTSNTVGYSIVQFDSGLNTLSLPLKPDNPMSLDALMSDIGADSISWLDQNDDWQTHPSNPTTPTSRIGEGYVVEFSAPSSHVFTGAPAAMIIHGEAFGFDQQLRDDITATVNPLGDVTVSWTPAAGADGYRVLRSSARDGFHTDSYISNDVVAPPFIDAGASAVAGEIYYMVVPYSLAQGDGSGTYSIGVITEEFNGNEMFGLPLKPIWGDQSADWYADQIPNCLGIVFLENGEWKAHFKEFPEGVYDTTIEMVTGYEISVFAPSRYSFVGW
jgi:hypothetical protein